MNKLPEEVKNFIEFLEFGHTEKAIKKGIEAVKLYPENYYAVFSLGLACRIQGNLKEATKNILQTALYNPYDASIFGNNYFCLKSCV